MEKITESDSRYRHLEQMAIADILTNINREDTLVPSAVEKAIPQIQALVEAIVPKMSSGGRLFYIGAGTSGRLGILDASEIPPTFGVPAEWVVGLIAGGDGAIRKAVENAEDDTTQAWKDLNTWQLDTQDVVVGIAASGTTPYVVSGLQKCQAYGITTACITCNPDAPILQFADFPIQVVVGPEFITGSSRMKAGTAQKLVLNMISTTVMIQLGRVIDNKMVDMQLTNAKLVDRGVKMVMQATDLEYSQAEKYLFDFGSVRSAIDHFNTQKKSGDLKIW